MGRGLAETLQRKNQLFEAVMNNEELSMNNYQLSMNNGMSKGRLRTAILFIVTCSLLCNAKVSDTIFSAVAKRTGHYRGMVGH